MDDLIKKDIHKYGRRISSAYKYWYNCRTFAVSGMFLDDAIKSISEELKSWHDVSVTISPEGLDNVVATFKNHRDEVIYKMYLVKKDKLVEYKVDEDIKEEFEK